MAMEPVEKIFDTWEDAEFAYYEENQCNSDDPDKEEGAIIRWLENNNFSVNE